MRWSVTSRFSSSSPLLSVKSISSLTFSCEVDRFEISAAGLHSSSDWDSFEFSLEVQQNNNTYFHDLGNLNYNSSNDNDDF